MDTSRKRTRGAGGRRWRAKKATAEYLERAALWYLGRYSSSSANLRRVLTRKVDRSVREHDTCRDDGLQLVDEIVARLERTGLLDDRRYAEARARSLKERGASPRDIRSRLLAKGVSSGTADAAIDSLAMETSDLELEAAIRYVRRRRIGPFRTGDGRLAARKRDMAAMARAGFDPATARTVLDAEDENALRGLIDPASV